MPRSTSSSARAGPQATSAARAHTNRIIAIVSRVMRALAVCLVLAPAIAFADSPWKAIEPGLDFAELDGPKNPIGDGHIRVLRIDPAQLDVELLNASASPAAKPRTAKEWCA